MFPRGDNSKIIRIYQQIFQILFSTTSLPISIKLGANHPWVMESLLK
jgi:hypothetical protein